MDDRGFRYGQHLFESIAVRNSVPLLLKEHLTTLRHSAKEKGIPFSKSMEAALRAIDAGKKLPDGMLRIYLTAGPGSPVSPIRMPALYVTWESTHFPTERELEVGMALRILKKPFSEAGWGLKTGNYEQHLLALEEARSAGADEGVVLDAKERVVSCAMGNLLVWLPSRSGTSVITPPSSRGARSGVVLGWTRSHARVLERDLRPSDLRFAVAMAVTNSRLGVMPVTTCAGKKLPEPSLALTLAHGYLRAHGLLGNA